MSRPLAPPPPVRIRRRLRLVVASLLRLAVLETRARRWTLPRLCAGAGLEFKGFESPHAPRDDSPLPRRVADVWWAVEQALHIWPWARRRPCLRRSLLLGAQLSDLGPALVLEVRRLDPLVAHATLVVRGQHLDMGLLDDVRTGAEATG